MHTVRNRVASRPRPMGKVKSASGHAKCRETAFMLKFGNPPAFPPGLIVPPPRGAVIATVPWPDITDPQVPQATAVPTRKRKPASRKPRKHSARKSAAKAADRKARGSPGKTRKAVAPTDSTMPPFQPVKQDITVPMTTSDLLDRALAMQAVPLPAPADSAAALDLPPPAPAAPPLAAGATPLPRSKALAHSRNGVFLDVIGDWLREARRWLTRWGSGSRKEEARKMVARANARHRALQSQAEALDALREVAAAD